jgi:hypothetical protein
MKWRERYAVHPAADVYPMMSDEELAKLGEDIKEHGLRHSIVLYATTRPGKKKDELDATSMMLIDGRNRLEAMERAGLSTSFTPCQMQMANDVENGDAASLIASYNINRRHLRLTKAQQAALIFASVKAEEEFSRQLGEKLEKEKEKEKRKRGRPANRAKAKATAVAKEQGISERTMERSIAKAEGRKPKPHKRRTEAEIERDVFLDYVSRLEYHEGPRLNAEARDLLTAEEKAEAVTVMESAIDRLQKAVDRLKDRAA